MNKYLKPMIIENADMPEGVYMASGTGTDSGKAKNYTIIQKYAGDAYNLYEQFQIVFSDLPQSGVENEFRVDLKVSGSATSAFAFNGGSCTLNGDTLTINFKAWTNYMDFQINCITHDISIS